MSVRIFPPSDEKHDDFEFKLDEFMGKWSDAFSLSFSVFFFDCFGRHVTHSTLPLWKVSVYDSSYNITHLHLSRVKGTCR